MSATHDYLPKPIDPPEKSLKYMAWSLKEMSGEFKKLVPLIEKNNALLEQIAQRMPIAQKFEQGTLPF